MKGKPPGCLSLSPSLPRPLLSYSQYLKLSLLSFLFTSINPFPPFQLPLSPNSLPNNFRERNRGTRTRRKKVLLSKSSHYLSKFTLLFVIVQIIQSSLSLSLSLSLSQVVLHEKIREREFLSSKFSSFSLANRRQCFPISAFSPSYSDQANTCLRLCRISTIMKIDRGGKSAEESSP